MTNIERAREWLFDRGCEARSGPHAYYILEALSLALATRELVEKKMKTAGQIVKSGVFIILLNPDEVDRLQLTGLWGKP